MGTLFDEKLYFPSWDFLGLLVRYKGDIQLSHASENETVAICPGCLFSGGSRIWRKGV